MPVTTPSSPSRRGANEADERADTDPGDAVDPSDSDRCDGEASDGEKASDEPSVAAGNGDGASDGTDGAAAASPGAPASHRREVNGGLAGIVAGCMVVGALLVTGVIAPPLRFSEGDATEAFMTAWKRSRTGTFVVESEWKRIKSNGDELVSATLLAQEPPKRLRRQLGTLSADIDGKHVECITNPEGIYGCSDGIPLRSSFDDDLKKEMDDLRDHFYSTKPPIYRVRTDGHGCFELVQTRPYPNPTFGRLAQLCFDEDTGALRYSERWFENIREVQRARTIHTKVLPSDFDLSQRTEYQAEDNGKPELIPDPPAPQPTTAGSAPPAGSGAPGTTSRPARPGG